MLQLQASFATPALPNVPIKTPLRAPLFGIVHAQARVPARWPYRERADWSAQITLVIDRSQHLRPYFGDQQQLLNALARRMGVAGLSTYTVHGDPLVPLTHWAGGREQPTPRQMAPPPPRSVVLLLTYMGCLRASANQDAQAVHENAPQTNIQNTPNRDLARWASVAKHLARHGARVLACPPCSAALLPADWSVGVAYLASGQKFLPKRALAHVNITQLAINTEANQKKAKKTEEKLERLLTLLSCARRIEPELVRAIRLLAPALAGEPGLEGLL